jgi:telomere length regulation protein
VNVQLLLLSAGYAQRLVPQFLHRLARSSTFLNGVSNRLGTSSTRARFLGMVVGESISEMTDKDGKAMEFGVEETTTEEAKWWKSIRHVEDTVGSVAGLDDTKGEMVVRKKKQSKLKTETQMSSVIQVIKEIKSEDEEDGDLMPYPKPDSDAEDSDDDPTLINRKKDTAPVYVNLCLYSNHAKLLTSRQLYP